MSRATIKNQAKELIRGKVFLLFLICAIVNILASSISFMANYRTVLGGYYSSVSSLSISTLSILLTPLTVAMAGYFVLFIRNQQKGEIGEGLGHIFKDAFSKNYVKYLLTTLLQGIFIILWSFLFIIPGVIMSFAYFFTSEIICDNPNLTPIEAIKLSKKITNGYKTDLFTLILSFIGNMLLFVITLGLYGIYFIPYFSTVKALYYENFKQRALQTGVARPDEFGIYPQPPVGDGTFQTNNINQQPINTEPTEQILPDILNNNDEQ